MKSIKEYCRSLIDPQLAPMAIQVALVVGTLLFIINHGVAVAKGKMTRQRWLSAVLTYVVPYCVNIHGQYTQKNKR